MKRCNSIQDKLMLYIEQELAENDVHQVEKHLKHCNNCQAELAGLKALSEKLIREDYDIPVSYSSELIVNLNERLSNRKFSLKKLVPSVSLVFAGLLVIISVIFMNGNEENILDQDYLLYQTYGGENLFYDVNAVELDTEISASVMPDNYFNVTREYLLEKTETFQSENINQVFAGMDDNTFQKLVKNLKSTEL